MSRVAVVGPGRVGGALALALAARGDDIVAVSGGSRGPDGEGSLSRFLRLLPDTPARDLADAVETADLVLVCTPDDVIADVARSAALRDAVGEGQRWVHTSGGTSLDALSAVAAAGGRTAACHPAMTFPDPQTGSQRLSGASWAVTADQADQSWAMSLVTDLGGRGVVVAPRDRVLYHAALTVGSNATTAVVTLARDLLLGAGIEDPAGFLEPLVTTSAVGGATRGADALTGPVRRGDVGTIGAHLAELQTSMPEALSIYRGLSELILAHAVRAGLPADRADAVRSLLSDGAAGLATRPGSGGGRDLAPARLRRHEPD